MCIRDRLHEQAGLDEAALVKQFLQPLAGGLLAGGVLLGHGLFAAALPQARLQRQQLFLDVYKRQVFCFDGNFRARALDGDGTVLGPNRAVLAGQLCRCV